MSQVSSMAPFRCKRGHSEYRWHKRGWRICIACKSLHSKQYYLNHKDMIKKKTFEVNRNINFGGNRELVIRRDGEKCLHCGITREQHKAKYGRDIAVDHIDHRGTGLRKMYRNNSIDNLQTLCFSCHSKKDRFLLDVKNIKISDADVKYIRQNYKRDGRRSNIKELAQKFGISAGYASSIVRGANRTEKIDGRYKNYDQYLRERRSFVFGVEG